jgi:hypothetical protein
MKTELKNAAMRFSALFKIRLETRGNEDLDSIYNRHYNGVSVSRLYKLGPYCGT